MLFQGSTAVVLRIVNPQVGGSNPSLGAKQVYWDVGLEAAII